MTDVFISYSSRNRDIADRIAKDLNDLGLTVFYDQEIVPGENWFDRLEEELKNAKNILVLLSPSYVASEWASKELEAAALSVSEGAARILPVLLEDTVIPPFLRGKYYADIREDYESGIKLIRKALTERKVNPAALRAQRARRIEALVQVVLSLIGSAASVVSLVGVAVLRSSETIFFTFIAFVFGFTVLVTLFLKFKPSKRSAPLELMTQLVQRAYVDALDGSKLNPTRVREANNG